MLLYITITIIYNNIRMNSEVKACSLCNLCNLCNLCKLFTSQTSA